LKVIRHRGSAINAIGRLYESPEAYSTTMPEAMKLLLQADISCHHTYTNAAAGSIKMVAFFVPMSAMMNGQRQGQAIHIAF